MLTLSGHLNPVQPGTFTNHEMFAPKALHRGPTTCLPMPSGSCKVGRNNSGVNSKGDGEGKGEDDRDDKDSGGRSHAPTALPPPLANMVLVKAVSETWMAAVIEEWQMEEDISEVFRLFLVLVEPPPGLSLDAIEGFPDYLRRVCDWLLRLPENGVRNVASHCWWIISGMFI